MQDATPTQATQTTEPLSFEEREALRKGNDELLWQTHGEHPLTETQYTRIKALSAALDEKNHAYHDAVYNQHPSEQVQRELAQRLKREVHALITETYPDVKQLLVDAKSTAFLSPDGLEAVRISFNANHYDYGKHTAHDPFVNDLFPEIAVRTLAKRRSTAVESDTIRAQSNIATSNMFYTNGKEQSVYSAKNDLRAFNRANEAPLDVDATYVGSNLLTEIEKEAVSLYRARQERSPEDALALRLTFNAVRLGNAVFKDSREYVGGDEDRYSVYSLKGEAIAAHLGAIYAAAKEDAHHAFAQVDALKTDDETKERIKAHLLGKGESLSSWQREYELAVVPTQTTAQTAAFFGAVHRSASATTPELEQSFEQRFARHFNESAHSLTQEPRFLESLQNAASNQAQYMR